MAGRPNRREEYRNLVEAYILKANSSSADYPLEVEAVANWIGCSRTTLYNHGLDFLIQEAAQQSNSIELKKKNDIEEKLSALENRHLQDEETIKGLTAKFVLIEANASRLGIDPEQLYQPMKKPDRSKSKAGRNDQRR
jgi:hypothetical protein